VLIASIAAYQLLDTCFFEPYTTYPNMTTPKTIISVSKMGGWTEIPSWLMKINAPPDNSEIDPKKTVKGFTADPLNFLHKLAPIKITPVTSNPLPSGRVVSTDQRIPHQISKSAHMIVGSLLSRYVSLFIFSSFFNLFINHGCIVENRPFAYTPIDGLVPERIHSPQ
jgi:hypothetical protein